MPYSALSDIKTQLTGDQLISLTDDVGIGSINSPILDQSILDADAVIDVYLAGRYSVPLSPVPAIIKRISVDLSIYNLYSRRKSVPETRKDRRDAGISLLKEISWGKASLGVTPQIASDQSGGPVSFGSGRLITATDGVTAGTLDNY